MEINIKSFKPGNQIVYTPDHAYGNFIHEDSEFGFVTSVIDDKSVFCRYWSKIEEGELRTKANSESTPIRCLHHFEYTDQKIVNHLMKKYGYL